jgi:hypothetical protein
LFKKIYYPYRLGCEVWIVTVEIGTQFKVIMSSREPN